MMNRVLYWLARAILWAQLGLAVWMAGMIASLWLGGWGGAGVAVGFWGAIIWARSKANG